MNINMKNMNYSSMIALNIISKAMTRTNESVSMNNMNNVTGKLNNLIIVRNLNRNARRPKKVCLLVC